MAAAEASFKIVMFSISFGLMVLSGFLIPSIPSSSSGRPSTTNKGSLLADSEEPPRIRMVAPAPGAPLFDACGAPLEQVLGRGNGTRVKISCTHHVDGTGIVTPLLYPIPNHYKLIKSCDITLKGDIQRSPPIHSDLPGYETDIGENEGFIGVYTQRVTSIRIAHRPPFRHP